MRYFGVSSEMYLGYGNPVRMSASPRTPPDAPSTSGYASGPPALRNDQRGSRVTIFQSARALLEEMRRSAQRPQQERVSR